VGLVRAPVGLARLDLEAGLDGGDEGGLEAGPLVERPALERPARVGRGDPARGRVGLLVREEAGEGRDGLGKRAGGGERGERFDVVVERQE